MSQLLRYFSLLPAGLVIIVFFQNCGQAGQISAVSPVVENITDTPILDSETYMIKSLPSTQFICSPFEDQNVGVANSGLKAQLAYVNTNMILDINVKNSYGAQEYFSGAEQFIKIPTTLYLSQINAPNQSFDQGFKLSDNSYLSNGSGEKLIEWFAIHMQSLLKLSSQEQAGEYEFATISDDGSRVYIGTELKEIINNDGAHSARMKCSTETVYMNRESKIPLTYYYNQGPRTEIANVLLWRKKIDNTPTGSYKHCGKSDRIKFWNPTGSQPGEYINDIFADGWRIVGVNNFELPSSQANPCATQNTNLISKVLFSGITNGAAKLDLEFASAANIKAKLYKISGADKVLMQSFDLSTQIKDKISLDFAGLMISQVYSLEVLLEMAGSGTQVLNEVRFELVKQ